MVRSSKRSTTCTLTTWQVLSARRAAALTGGGLGGLDLDFDKDAAAPSWFNAIRRRVQAKVAQGATPQKRNAPAGGIYGQINPIQAAPLA
jgi:hypothetical protein